MSSPTPAHFNVLVIGGGPAGMAAALRAAQTATTVVIVDDNPALGGQIWRANSGDAPPESTRWQEALANSRVTTLCGMRVLDQPRPGVLLAEGHDGSFRDLHYQNLVIATGARERYLPFPGWTLPNVMGAGGLQAMVKGGLPIRGKRVIVAGTGPLLLAVAAYLQQKGAEIPIICEQASWTSLSRFSLAVSMHPRKIAESLKLLREIQGIPLAANSWPIAAHGHDFLENVTISRNGSQENIRCDYLAFGFHLVPNTELAALLGCRIENGFVQVDEFQRTSIANVFCAGELTGIGGAELSIVEGEIAGLSAVDRSLEAKRLMPKRRRAASFVAAMNRAFQLRPELARLSSPETFVCRCEDVTYSQLQGHSSWRGAKLHTRCGMGACQGRICGPACEILFGWKMDSVRPPVFPATVASLSAEADTRSLTGGVR